MKMTEKILYVIIRYLLNRKRTPYTRIYKIHGVLYEIQINEHKDFYAENKELVKKLFSDGDGK